MAQGRPMLAKLLLEGKEVPFIGATITSSVGQASIAYVDVVPQAEINHIAPRTHVSIHVRNFHDKIAGETGYPYIVAWEGEVFGFSFGKTPTSRTFTLHCIDHTSYWDNVLAYFFDPQKTMGQGGDSVINSAIPLTTAKNTATAVVPVNKSSSSFFQTVLNKTLDNPDNDFLDGIVAICKEIGKVNAFYEEAQKRLRVNDRTLLHSSKKLKELIDYGVAKDWIFGILGRSSGYATLRMVLQDLLDVIFHDFVSIPFPARVEKPGTEPPIPTTDNKQRTIGNFIFKPNLFTIPPPTCNVFYPDEYSSFQFQRNFFKEPTRLLYFPQMPVVLTQQKLSIPMQAIPDSLQHFLYEKGTNPYKGDGSMQVSGADAGHVNDENSAPFDEANATKRMGQFLTNEEKLKGIWTAVETMVPATSQFAANLEEAYQTKFLRQVANYLFYKKRFENRSLQITSHLKMSVVPGFNVLILDDSDAQQNVLAYCSSVTHRIYATEGGYTNVMLSYARTANEEDQASKGGGEPMVPPWFSESIFGSPKKDPPSEVADKETENKTLYVSPNALSDFYKTLLGELGSTAITNYNPNEPTVIGAVKKLLEEYREAKTKGVEAVQDLIAKTTSRDYARMRDVYRFLGVPEDKIPPNLLLPFIEFTGGPFPDWSKITAGPEDVPRKLRWNVVQRYREALKKYRGFRG